MTAPGSKFQVRDGQNLSHPAKCFCCGRTSRGEGDIFVDFGVDLEEFGAIYFCISCGKEMAVAIEYAPVAEKMLTEAELARTAEHAGSLENQLEEINNALATLGITIPGTVSPNDSSDSVPSSEDESVRDSVVATVESRSTKSRAGK
jgi:hypothetical protein